MTYEIIFSDDADDHLATLPSRDKATLVDAIESRLRHEPESPTRNRKPMDPDRRGFIAPWELRVGKLRVYYAVEEVPQPAVVIVAIGIKTRERVRIGGRDVEP